MEQNSYEKMTIFNEMIDEKGLTDFHLRKPLLDGNQICDIVGVKPGKVMKFLIDEVWKF